MKNLSIPTFYDTSGTLNEVSPQLSLTKLIFKITNTGNSSISELNNTIWIVDFIHPSSITFSGSTFAQNNTFFDRAQPLQGQGIKVTGSTVNGTFHCAFPIFSSREIIFNYTIYANSSGVIQTYVEGDDYYLIDLTDATIAHVQANTYPLI